MKKIVKNFFHIFFQRNLTYSSQKLKMLIFKTWIVLIFYYQIFIFGADNSVSIF